MKKYVGRGNSRNSKYHKKDWWSHKRRKELITGLGKPSKKKQSSNKTEGDKKKRGTVNSQQ